MLSCSYICLTNKKEMKNSANYQKTMNQYLAKKMFRLAYKSFLMMNKCRIQEGLEFLSMPNLQARFETCKK